MFIPARRSTIAEHNLLQKENDGLRTEIVKLRHELTGKQGYAERLEVLLRERLERIDELTGRIDQLRERNKRLEAEAEHLAAMAANRPADHPTHLGNILRGAFEGLRKLKLEH
jgi:chromosome segregation ATPase